MDEGWEELSPPHPNSEEGSVFVGSDKGGNKIAFFVTVVAVLSVIQSLMASWLA